MSTIIEFQEVSKQYGEKKVIDGLNLKIEAGEIFILVGPSGSGKTSTLKMINALSTPTTGDIYFKGKKIKDYDLKKLRWQMGYVLQQIALFPNMTVEQNIEVIPEMLGWDRKKRKQTTAQLLQQVGLDPKKYGHRYPNELSGGEQQRVGILRAIAASPEVILMDEPFSALDPLSRTSLQELVLDLHQQLGSTLVFVTHNMQEAMKLGDRISIMQEGKLLQCDRPEIIQNEPKNEFVRTFFEETAPFESPNHKKVRELIDQKFFTKEDNNELSQINIDADFTELFALLAKKEQVNVLDESKQQIGTVSRKQVFSFLSQ